MIRVTMLGMPGVYSSEALKEHGPKEIEFPTGDNVKEGPTFISVHASNGDILAYLKKDLILKIEVTVTLTEVLRAN